MRKKKNKKVPKVWNFQIIIGKSENRYLITCPQKNQHSLF